MAPRTPLTATGSRWMLSIVAQLSLTPFDVRFREIKERLDQQDKVIRHEVQITQLEISMAQLTAQERVLENTTKLAQPIAMRKNEATTNLESIQASYEKRWHDYTELSESAIKRLREQTAEYVKVCNEQQRFFEK